MKKEYLTPEFEVKKVYISGDVLAVSNPEVTTPSEVATLPREDNEW